MPKFNKKENELNTIIDQWIYFIKNAENLNIIPKNVKDEGLKYAYEDADKHNWTKAELDAYDYVLMREQDDRGRWTFATRREKEKVKNDIAKKLIKLSLPIADIADTTGLTVEQVQKLKDKL